MKLESNWNRMFPGVEMSEWEPILLSCCFVDLLTINSPLVTFLCLFIWPLCGCLWLFMAFVGLSFQLPLSAFSWLKCKSPEAFWHSWLDVDWMLDLKNNRGEEREKVGIEKKRIIRSDVFIDWNKQAEFNSCIRVYLHNIIVDDHRLSYFITEDECEAL